MGKQLFQKSLASSNSTLRYNKLYHPTLIIYVWSGLLEDKIQQGYLVAPSKSMAHKQLVEQQIIVVSINAINKITPRFYKKKELLLLFEQLTPLLQVGIPLLQSIKIITQQQSSHWQRLLEIMITRINLGLTLSQALNDFIDIIPKFYIYFIKLGEETGCLDECLQHLIQQQQQQLTQQQKIKQALRYPLFLLCCAISLLITVLLFILPEMEQLYSISNLPLPSLTRQLIRSSQAFVAQFPWYMSIGITLYLIYKTQRKQSIYIQTFEKKLLLHTPYLNYLLTYSFLSYLFYAIYLLLQIGMPLLKCIDVILDGNPFMFYQDILKNIQTILKTGQTLQYAMGQHPKVFSPLCCQLVHIGETPGKLDVVFLKLHEHHQKTLQQNILKLSNLVAPMMTILIALFLGVTLLALYIPIFKLGDTL